MAEMTLVIAGRHYAIRCRDGEEAHLGHLATLIEDKARRALLRERLAARTAKA